MANFNFKFLKRGYESDEYFRCEAVPILDEICVLICTFINFVTTEILNPQLVISNYQLVQ